MRVVTTCNKEGFERYGHRLLETWKHWPLGAELWWYAEGFTIPETPGVVQISVDKLQGLTALKSKFGNFVPPSYMYDVVKFAHKVYAACDALAEYDGVGVWLDADCVMLQDIPPGYVEGHLQRAYLALLKRKGLYTETGFWIADCSHEYHQEFLQTWAAWYDSGAFKTLDNWTDCETLDATVRMFEKKGLISTVSLSGEHEKHMHPMTQIELGKYIDHCKGRRKIAGHSPEARP